MRGHLYISQHEVMTVILRESKYSPTPYVCVEVGESSLWLDLEDARELVGKLSEKVAEAEAIAEAAKEQAA